MKSITLATSKENGCLLSPPSDHCRSVHLSAIARKAGCELHEMLFFDNQQNNIDVGDRIRVTSILTPEGVSHKIFDDSISKHRKKIKEMKKGK